MKTKRQKSIKIAICICTFILLSAIAYIAIDILRSNDVYKTHIAPPNTHLPQEETIRTVSTPRAIPVDHETPVLIDGDFPSLHITSVLNPFEQERNYWHRGTLSLTNHSTTFSNVDIRLRGRGNSTWLFGEDKRPLRLRFESPQSLLGSPYSARDWVLISNHFDLTLMRTYLAFYLASMLEGMDWSPSAKFVHLYINGEYVGIYQVSDERDIQPGRMQLVFNEDPTISEYLFELDGVAFYHGIHGVDSFIVDDRSYDIRFPRNEMLTPDHVEYVRSFVESVTDVLQTRDYDAIRAIVDIPSFVDFYLVQEFFKNIDIGLNSVFMQIRGQGEDRRLYFGPVWDFDRSAGNMYYWYTAEHLHAAVRNHFFRYLVTTPEIFAHISDRWNEISSNQVSQMVARAEYYFYNYGEVFDRNFDTFPLWDTVPLWMTRMIPSHLHEIDNWTDQMDHMLYWFEGRVWWLNQFFGENYELRNWWLDFLLEDI